ncbi:hypothetical protein AB0F81_03435 [Actinoplanes sp. NPDC024001]|uniref:hypothetical protein n=1 Tax=Actinoplanes sp. NPDC024001 TaxID=3154598 RepID=UPI0033CE43B5
MRRPASIITILTVTGAALLASATAAAAHPSTADGSRCAPARPGTAFYEGGRIASTPVTVPDSACSTISVSHIRDVRNPADKCQTFLIAYLGADGEATYSEPVQACSVRPRQRTVLATDVPDGTEFRVLYQVDYIDPAPQRVRFTVWR